MPMNQEKLTCDGLMGADVVQSEWTNLLDR